jgi:hypothetical protein
MFTSRRDIASGLPAPQSADHLAVDDYPISLQPIDSGARLSLHLDHGGRGLPGAHR